MALQKAITLDNGITLNYHRIASLNKITNSANIIEVISYLDAQKREKEKANLVDEQKTGRVLSSSPYTYINYISKEYNENETIKDAYQYLKDEQGYDGAQDI